MKSAFARQEDHFQKNICPKRTYPSDFVKLGSKILNLFLAEKKVVCCCLFVCLLQICPIFDLFFNWSTHRAEKDALKETIWIIWCTVWELLNRQGTQILQIYWIYKDAIDLTSRWKVRFRQTFFLNEAQKVLYKPVLISDLISHFGWSYSLSNFRKTLKSTKSN